MSLVKDIKHSYKNSLNWLNCSSKQNKYRPYIIGFITTFLARFRRLSVLFHMILALVTKEVSHVWVSYENLVKCSLRCDSFWVPVRLFAPKSATQVAPLSVTSFSCWAWLVRVLLLFGMTPFSITFSLLHVCLCFIHANILPAWRRVTIPHDF